MGAPLNANQTQPLYIDLSTVISPTSTGVTGSIQDGAGGLLPATGTVYTAPITNYPWARAVSILSSGSNAYDLTYRRTDAAGHQSESFIIAASGLASTSLRTNTVSGVLLGNNFQIGLKNLSPTATGNFMVAVQLFG